MGGDQSMIALAQALADATEALERARAAFAELDEYVPSMTDVMLDNFTPPGEFGPLEPEQGDGWAIIPARPEGLATRFCPRTDQHPPHKWDDFVRQEDCWCEGIPF